MKVCKYILLLVVIFYSSLITAQTEKQEDGYYVFKYPNGAVSSEGYIRDGKPDGYWKSYWVTGVIKSEGKRRNFMLDSVWVFYTQTGDTLEKIDYVVGKKSGYYLKYKRDNIHGLYIWSRELYAADKREGTAYLYFPDGSIKQTLPYKKGKKQGLSREYEKNGNLITLFEYNNDFLIARERINRYDNEGLRQGAWKEFYGNGNLHLDMNYRDDRLHGYYKEYNEKGILAVSMLYDNGNIVEDNLADDPEIEIINRYDNAGRLIYSGPYRQSSPVGVHREYNPEDGSVFNSYIYNDNGIKMSEGIVNDQGERGGKWKNFFENGNVREEGEYLGNRRSGTWKFYDLTGKVIQTGSFRNGRPDGLWQWFYEDGSILREEEYFQGNRDGNFAEYSNNGEIISRGQYADGEKNGDWLYTVGDYMEEGKYIIGLRDGVWKYFDNEENLIYKGNYIQDNPHGYHFFYYENGKVKEEQYYSMGIKQRTWKKYDEEGNVIMSIRYKDDLEISINGVKVDLPGRDVKLIK